MTDHKELIDRLEKQASILERYSFVYIAKDAREAATALRQQQEEIDELVDFVKRCRHKIEAAPWESELNKGVTIGIMNRLITKHTKAQGSGE